MAELRIHQVSDRRTGRAWLIVAEDREQAEARWRIWMTNHSELLPPDAEWYLVYGTVIL